MCFFFNCIDLFFQLAYYQNVGQAEEKTKPKAPVVPRQPASSCMAEEMNRLRLNMSAATGNVLITNPLFSQNQSIFFLQNASIQC